MSRFYSDREGRPTVLEPRCGDLIENLPSSDKGAIAGGVRFIVTAVHVAGFVALDTSIYIEVSDFAGNPVDGGWAPHRFCLLQRNYPVSFRDKTAQKAIEKMRDRVATKVAISAVRHYGFSADDSGIRYLGEKAYAIADSLIAARDKKSEPPPCPRN